MLFHEPAFDTAAVLLEAGGSEAQRQVSVFGLASEWRVGYVFITVRSRFLCLLVVCVCVRICACVCVCVCACVLSPRFSLGPPFCSSRGHGASFPSRANEATEWTWQHEPCQRANLFGLLCC